jgi:hypothetical protein
MSTGTPVSVAVSSNPLVNLVSVVVVVVLVSVLKKLENSKLLTDRVKDVVYPVLSVVLSGVAMFLGYIDVSSISDVLAYLVAPSGLWVTVNKVLGLKQNNK